MNRDITYEVYQKAPKNLLFEEAMDIYRQILDQAPEDDTEFDKVWNHALQRMTVYAHLRAGWKQTPKAERDNDARTIKHDAVIESLDLLSSYMDQAGLNTDWRSQLGDAGTFRKRLGDFACYVALIYGLSAR